MRLLVDVMRRFTRQSSDLIGGSDANGYGINDSSDTIYVPIRAAFALCVDN